VRHQVITCQLVAVSALKMCQDIKKKGTTTDGEGKPLNPMPFTAMLTNSVVWGLYGLGRRDFTSECATSPGQFKTQHNRNVEDKTHHWHGGRRHAAPLPCNIWPQDQCSDLIPIFIGMHKNAPLSPMKEGARVHHSYGSYAPSTYGSYEPRRANPSTARDY
jgi:hypothetical protein